MELRKAANEKRQRGGRETGKQMVGEMHSVMIGERLRSYVEAGGGEGLRGVTEEMEREKGCPPTLGSKVKRPITAEAKQAGQA